MHIWDYLIKGQEEKGTTEDKMVDGITDLMDVSLSELRELVMDRVWFPKSVEVSGYQVWLITLY